MSVSSATNAAPLDTFHAAPTAPPPGSANNIKPPPATNDMANAMEEITMKFSESVERNSKSLEERTVKPRTLLRIEKLEALYGLLTGNADNKQDGEVRRLLAMGQQSISLSQLLEHAGGDPTKAEVLAQHALHRARRQGDSTTAHHLQQVMQALHSEHGDEVRAGINTAEALALFSQEPQQRQSMRQLYYRSIVGQASLVATFDALLSQFDERHFGQGIHTLMRAMSDDLSSAFPSLPPSQLRMLLRDLTASQQLTNILNGCRELLGKLVAHHPNLQMSPARLTRRLLDLTQANVYPREIKTLSEDIVGQAPLDHLQFLNALYPRMQQLPLPIWKDGKSRQSTLNLLLRMMTEYTQYERQQMAPQASESPSQADTTP